jgi:hypothetical protein
MIEETNYRLERKFFITGVNIKIIENYIRLNNAHFKAIYKPRQINNIYFDTNEFDNFYFSYEGIAHRVKVRIRWYGATLGLVKKPVLELKFKDNFFVKKKLFPMVSFELNKGFKVETIYRALKMAKIPWLTRSNLFSLRPMLLNSYKRRYYQSFDKNYRLTLDEKMKFFRITGCQNNLLYSAHDKKSLVLELKYSPKNDNMAEVITNSFPFRMTKSSKYVDGVIKLYE